MRHPFDFRDEAQALLSDRIGVLETEVDELTAENAKLREQLTRTLDANAALHTALRVTRSENAKLSEQLAEVNNDTR